jgi:hypothetical protein
MQLVEIADDLVAAGLTWTSNKFYGAVGSTRIAAYDNDRLFLYFGVSRRLVSVSCMKSNFAF